MLDEVRARGFVVCGVAEGKPGFSTTDGEGQWVGFDVDICRAVAAAVLSDAAKVQFRPLMPDEQLKAVKQGEVDVLARGVGWSMSLEIADGVRYAGTSFFNGLGLMVRRELGITSALELTGARICSNPVTGAEVELLDYFTSRKMPVEVVSFEKAEDAMLAYDAKRCEVLAAPLAGLSSQRLKLTTPDEHMILPDLVTQTATGPVVRQGDEAWWLIVHWTLMSLLVAEQIGLDSSNVEEWATSGPAVAQRLLGGGVADLVPPGLDPDWAERVIASVGNYAQIYDRHLGPDTPVGLARGHNALWSAGGLMVAPLP